MAFTICEEMGYELHIERTDGTKISDSEWKAAVAELPSLRLARSDAVAHSPLDSHTVIVKKKNLDVELLHETRITIGLKKKKEWIYTFSYSRGTVTFRAPLDIESCKNPTMDVARFLAAKLNAKIVGDEGEEYE